MGKTGQKRGQCYLAIGIVAKELQLSHWAVERTNDDLIRTGLITREQH